MLAANYGVKVLDLGFLLSSSSAASMQNGNLLYLTGMKESVSSSCFLAFYFFSPFLGVCFLSLPLVPLLFFGLRFFLLAWFYFFEINFLVFPLVSFPFL